MDLVRTTFNHAADGRRMLLRRSGAAYALKAVEYSWLIQADVADGDFAAVALSTRSRDQRDDAISVPLTEMAADVQIFAPQMLRIEKPTDVGLSVLGNHLRIPLENYEVPFLAAIFQETWTTGLTLSVSLWFESFAISKIDLARMVLAVGGLPRTDPQ